MRSKDDRISGTEDGRNPPLPNFTSGGSFYKPSLIAGANSVSPSFQGGGVSWRFRDKVSRLVGATWPTLNPKSPRDYPSWALRCCGGPPPSPLFQDLSREIHFRHPPPPHPASQLTAPCSMCIHHTDHPTTISCPLLPSPSRRSATQVYRAC